MRVGCRGIRMVTSFIAAHRVARRLTPGTRTISGTHPRDFPTPSSRDDCYRATQMDESERAGRRSVVGATYIGIGVLGLVAPEPAPMRGPRAGGPARSVGRNRHPRDRLRSPRLSPRSPPRETGPWLALALAAPLALLRSASVCRRRPRLAGRPVAAVASCRLELRLAGSPSRPDATWVAGSR